MRRLSRGLMGLLLLVGGVRAVAYLGYAARILPSPFEVFHLEAKMVHLAWRVQAGVRLYPPWRVGPHVANFFGPVDFLIVGGLGSAVDADLTELSWIGRAVSFAAGLAATLLVGVVAGRRYGRGAGLAAAVVSLGAAPMIGFSVMTRPDLLAELLGFGGFVLAVRPSVTSAMAGGAMLVLAALTKQTAAVYLLAAAAATAAEGRWRRSGWLLGGGLATLAAIVGAVTILIEPNFLACLLEEGRTPLAWPTWAKNVRRLGLLAPDLIVLPALGLVTWTARPPREPRPAALAAVLLAASLLTAGKSGADLNYFLGLRLVAGLAAGALWRRAAEGRAAVALAALIGAAALAPGAGHSLSQALAAHREAALLASPAGRSMRGAYARLFRMAEDPSVRLLTDRGLIALHRRERAEFVDPWLFRMLAQTGRLDPGDIRGRIEAEDYDMILTTADLRLTDYETYEFGLPPALVGPARRHYTFAGRQADLFVYLPRARRARP